MSLHDDQKTFLPSLLADLNRGQDDPSSSRSSREHNYHYNQQQQHSKRVSPITRATKPKN
jgi:hypothetical protein